MTEDTLLRRAFHVQGWSLKRICRELHVSRNTVRKILMSDETSFSYEREWQPKPKIGPWQDQLDGFLNGNRGRAAREQLTLIRIYEELCSLGYEGGYDAVRRCAKNWAKAQGSAMADAYVPLIFAPGEAYQFDWSHEIVLINGKIGRRFPGLWSAPLRVDSDQAAVLPVCRMC